MRRSTAAAVGTLTGAALILGVRLSVQPAAVPAEAAAPVAQEVTGEPAPADTSSGAKKPAASSSKSSSKPSSKKKEKTAEPTEAAPDEGGLQSGTYQGKAVQNQYGTVQVTIKVSDGKISSATATYPKNGFSGTINPNAVAKLSQETLKKQSADVDAVSGATFTSRSYVTSLQAALDAAGA